MKVAVIGAGMSGLSCAMELQRHNIKAKIFEKKNSLGQDLNLTIASANLFHRKLGDPIKHLRKKYGLKLKPLSAIDKIIMKGPRSQAVLNGVPGYTFLRGEGKSSIENQIASCFKPDIEFDRYLKIEDVIDEYDAVCVATGDSKLVKELDMYTATFNAYTRIATVLGDFNPGEIMFWLNNKFSKHGFGFQIAENEKKAYIALTVNDITYFELDHYWERFLDIENIKSEIIEVSDHEQNIGYPHSFQKGKVYFLGNSAGLIDDFVGFGAANAVESGFLAGRALAENLDYGKMVKPLSNNVRALREYRLAVNTLTNTNYDMLLKFINIPGIKQVLYNNPFYKARFGAPIAKLYNSLVLKK